MSIKDNADYLASSLARLCSERANLAQDASIEMSRKFTSLDPILSVMRKYKIPFRNALVEGSSFKGAVIGESAAGDKTLLHVFDGLDVRLVDSETDEYSDGERILFEAYLDTCDFEKVKAGISFIESLTTAAVDEEKQRTQEILRLTEFLKRTE